MGRPPGRSKTMCFSSRRLCGSSLCGRLLPRDASAQGGGRPADRGMPSFGCVGNARGGGNLPLPPVAGTTRYGRGGPFPRPNFSRAGDGPRGDLSAAFAAGGGQGRRNTGSRRGDCRGGRTADTSRRPGKGEREGYFRASVGYRSGHSRAAPGGGSGKDRRRDALGGEGVSAGRAVLDEREGRTRLQGGISGDQGGVRKVFLSGEGAFGREGGVPPPGSRMDL